MFKTLIYRLKQPFHLIKTGLLQALPAARKAGFPAKKLQVICITGTDGKTTSSTLLYHVLKAAGKKVALLSTVAAYIGNEEIDTGFHVTTPDPKLLQNFMKKMVDQGYEYLVLESTSHGIYQHRLWGVTPKIVGYTNITMEHLDYHLTHDLYVQAKASLGRRAQQVVLNADDELSFGKLKKIFARTNVKVLTYSLDMELSRKIKQGISARFPEAYNQANARLVYTIGQQLEVEDAAYLQGIEDFQGVPGRMQWLSPKLSRAHIQVIVDFAHTPNALEKALTAILQKMKHTGAKGRLIAVFGCAGLRDRQKRPSMGRVAGELADLAVFTAEDPRTEDIWSIMRQMKSELGENHGKVVTIPDRRQAIFFALQKLAEPGDVVGIFGKGHEKSMCYGKVEYPWSDVAVATEALQTRKAR